MGPEVTKAEILYAPKISSNGRNPESGELLIDVPKVVKEKHMKILVEGLFIHLIH